MADVLAGRRIVVPETRELDLLARMLEQHGAVTIRCPMVAISDVPDAGPVVAWLCRFTTNPPDDLILMTGEGLERLVGFARRADLGEAFLAALAEVRKITRGPKPVRRLRAFGLTPDLAPEPPTTAGIISSLSRENLTGRRVAIQLYPDNPNAELLNFLRAAGASPDPVLCYVYGSEAVDRRVIHVIEAMAAGRVDLIAFTSTPQVRRMQQVAKANQLEETLQQAFLRTRIAAVGPVVARAIEGAQHRGAAVVRGKLLVEVSDEADLQLLGQKLRSAPIEMRIYSTGISRRLILEIARKSQHSREFVAGLRIEISVTDAAVDGAMAEADIRQIAGTVQADRNVAGQIGHVIVDPSVPAIAEHWNEIGKARRVLLKRNGPCDGYRRKS
jgi:uroporphyrinogen-III synthase